MSLFFCDLLAGITLYRWIFAISVTSILCGIIFQVIIRTNGYPQKYIHPNLDCINCGRDMHLFGECCTYGKVTEYDCVSYEVCKQMEQKHKESDQEMLGWGKMCLIGGCVVLALVVLVAVVLYRRERRRQSNAHRRIEGYIVQEQNIQRRHGEEAVARRAQPVGIRRPQAALPRRAQPAARRYAPVYRIDINQQENKIVFVDNSAECTICLTQFDQILAVEIRKNCKHKFHRNCLREWERRNPTCPVCRGI